MSGGDVEALTTQQGIPVSDDQNTLRAGCRACSALLEDFHFREKIFHFDHERHSRTRCARPRLRRAWLFRD